MKKHFNIRVSGKVQGVFFRASTKEKADSLHLTGFVRNEWDGSVYAEAEGDEAELREFINWCREGPPRARVERCEVQEGAVRNFSRFAVQT